MAGRGRLAFAAMGFAAAAGLSSWNPIAAPFGLVVGLVAAVIAIRALRQGGRRYLALAALAVAVLSMAGSGLVLLLTAGVGREPSGAVVSAPAPAEAARTLDDAAARTREARERARQELGKVDEAPAPPARRAP